MMYSALSMHKNIPKVLCASMRFMKTIFAYSNRTFADVSKLLLYALIAKILIMPIHVNLVPNHSERWRRQHKLA